MVWGAGHSPTYDWTGASQGFWGCRSRAWGSRSAAGAPVWQLYGLPSLCFGPNLTGFHGASGTRGGGVATASSRPPLRNIGGVEAKVRLPRVVRCSRGTCGEKQGFGRRIASGRSDTRPDESASAIFFSGLRETFLLVALGRSRREGRCRLREARRRRAARVDGGHRPGRRAHEGQGGGRRRRHDGCGQGGRRRPGAVEKASSH